MNYSVPNIFEDYPHHHDLKRAGCATALGSWSKAHWKVWELRWYDRAPIDFHLHFSLSLRCQKTNKILHQQPPSLIHGLHPQLGGHSIKSIHFVHCGTTTATAVTTINEIIRKWRSYHDVSKIVLEVLEILYMKEVISI